MHSSTLKTPTAESLSRLDLLEHTLLFKSGCFFYRVYTVLATLESSHWICLLLIRPESLQVCYVVNVLHNENDFFSIMKMILAHSFRELLTWV